MKGEEAGREIGGTDADADADADGDVYRKG